MININFFQAMLKDALRTISAAVEGRYTDKLARERRGYRRECVDAQGIVNDQDEVQFNLNLKAKLGFFINAITGGSVAGRRRRSTCKLTNMYIIILQKHLGKAMHPTALQDSRISQLY